LKNFVVITFLILVITIWYLLSIDYFGIYKSKNNLKLTYTNSKQEGEDKYLILQQQDKNLSAISVDTLIEYREEFENLPFSGAVIYANSFSDRVMQNKPLEYKDIQKELAPIKDLNITSSKSIFLLINIDFPGDFWNSEIWNRVTKNFANIARVAKELKFRGIVLNSIPLTESGYKMINFKFPSKEEVEENLTIYQPWEIIGAKYYKETIGYRNRDYNFQEHIKKVTQLFRKIMVSISTNYPNITLLVYSAIDSNTNSTKRVPSVYKNAIFLGLQKGAFESSKIYDMAYVDPKSIKEIYFQNSYFWRKYGVAEDRYNNELNSSWQWKIPKSDRDRWIKRVKVGFIIDTKKIKRVGKISSAIKKALKYSDGYVVLFSRGENWLTKKRNRRLNVLERRIKKILDSKEAL